MAQPNPTYNINIPALIAPQDAHAAATAAPSAAAGIQVGDQMQSTDVIQAKRELKKRKQLHDVDLVTDDELVDASTRSAAVQAQQVSKDFPAAEAPPWFQPAIQAALQPLATDVRFIKTKMLITANENKGDGVSRPWEIVPFVNGDDPTGPPYNLQPIGSLSTVQRLPANQCNAYLLGYGLPIAGPINDRRLQLARHLGYLGLW